MFDWIGVLKAVGQFGVFVVGLVSVDFWREQLGGVR